MSYHSEARELGYGFGSRTGLRAGFWRWLWRHWAHGGGYGSGFCSGSSGGGDRKMETGGLAPMEATFLQTREIESAIVNVLEDRETAVKYKLRA